MGCCNSKPKEQPKKAEEKPKREPKPQRPPTPVQEEQPERAVEKEDPARLAEQRRAERLAAIAESRQRTFRYGHCTVEGGEVHPLFKEGLVHRIVKDGVWYIYNDTLDYEAHVEYRFGPGSKIVPGERTSIEELEDGWIVARAVVYPLETIEYISGTYYGFKSAVSAKPVSAEYISKMSAEANAFAAKELAAVKNLVGDESDEEIVLARCIENDVPYVDVNFQPNSTMMARPSQDAREMPPVAMQRPTQYLPPAQAGEADAILGAVVPESIDPGYMGDCWIACAAAVLAEDEEAVKGVFAKTKPQEHEAGAYRVALSKHGWWRSVIVDSYLPTVSNVPVTTRVADDPRELWVSLLEKAYAKVHGSYATITGGDALQMVQDVTGAPTYRFDKEWEAAVMNVSKVGGFVQKLVKASEAGYGLVLCTPGHNSTTYLGCKRDSNPDAFKEKYAAVGLRCGYTYAVKQVVTAGGVTLFQVHNPWHSETTWTGPWSARSNEWKSNRAARDACQPDRAPAGTYWISWNDAINYFDGGGVIYQAGNTVDYRVKGKFYDVIPSVVLEMHVKEPVTVSLVLSQQDKRGGADNDAGLRFAPCMLSVAQHNGRRHVVETNTSWDPVAPSAEYNFTVARDMAMTYHFEPNAEPYLVVPRIHRKGIAADYDRPYVIGVISAQPLDGKVDIRCTRLDSNSRVFKNLITFNADELPPVEAEHQVHRTGELAESGEGEMVVGTVPVRAASAKAPASSAASSSEAALSHEDDEEQPEEQPLEAVEEPQEVTITDGAGTPINEAPQEQQQAERGVAEQPVATPVEEEQQAAEAHEPAGRNSD